MRGGWQRDPLGDVAECWRASIAVDKAFGAGIRQARASGVSWERIGRRLGVVENASSEAQLLEAVGTARRRMGERFWNEAT